VLAQTQQQKSELHALQEKWRLDTQRAEEQGRQALVKLQAEIEEKGNQEGRGCFVGGFDFCFDGAFLLVLFSHLDLIVCDAFWNLFSRFFAILCHRFV
jgi:hypothetical protein